MASKSNLNLAVEKLKDAGVRPEIWRGGRHWRIRWRQANGIPKTITVSSNPWARRDVLRELRKLGIE